MNINAATAESVKKSYFNILGFFLNQEKIESRYMRCLLKWGFQLRLSPNDVSAGKLHDLDTLQFTLPTEKAQRLEALYHLVHMIYLDKVVEDVELEVASMYAQQLGFNAALVGDLFKSIATAAYDVNSPQEVKREVLDFLKLYNM